MTNFDKLVKYGHTEKEAERLDKAGIECHSEDHEIWCDSIAELQEMQEIESLGHDY